MYCLLSFNILNLHFRILSAAEFLRKCPATKMVSPNGGEYLSHSPKKTPRKRKLSSDSDSPHKLSYRSSGSSSFSQSDCSDQVAPKTPRLSSSELRHSVAGYNSSPSATPSPRDNKHGWYESHDKFVSMAERSKSEVLLTGDSIAKGLSLYPRIWNKYFKPIGTLNFGFGGDRTQHVLWRVENGEIPHYCKYAIIHCGTNNIDRDRPRDIADGVLSIGLTIQEALPNVKVIITGLFPRDREYSFRRDKIKQVNVYLKNGCSHSEIRNFYFIQPDEDWCLEDGKLNEELYYQDCLHLNDKGDEKFAKSIIKMLDKVKEKKDVDTSQTSSGTYHVERIQGAPRSDIKKRSLLDNTPEPYAKRSKVDVKQRLDLEYAHTDMNESVDTDIPKPSPKVTPPFKSPAVKLNRSSYLVTKLVSVHKSEYGEETEQKPVSSYAEARSSSLQSGKSSMKDKLKAVSEFAKSKMIFSDLKTSASKLKNVLSVVKPVKTKKQEQIVTKEQQDESVKATLNSIASCYDDDDDEKDNE